MTLPTITQAMANTYPTYAKSGQRSLAYPVSNFESLLAKAASGEHGSTASNVSSTDSARSTKTQSYLTQLQVKFGSKVSVQNMAYSKTHINQIGSSTIGTGNVIIASNILEKMASDPQASQYYEQKVQAHFDTIGEAHAFMAVRGRQIVSSGVIVHPNGEVTYYSSSDYTPEEKARLEKAMKEEDEAKARKRAEERRWIESNQRNDVGLNTDWLLVLEMPGMVTSMNDGFLIRPKIEINPFLMRKYRSTLFL